MKVNSFIKRLGDGDGDSRGEEPGLICIYLFPESQWQTEANSDLTNGGHGRSKDCS
jgi:hypothetical protein